MTVINSDLESKTLPVWLYGL